ncbi:MULTISPECIES: hypothetical protein [Microbulbifer]|uniref:hypothetical protein n=1 Tax=Microbulbifer TaxID=48073 RepID=UPI001E33A47C|nr:MULTISPECIES: hypothetical protein [Microbulbifer]UHQ55290.1 hypothetical protein LVE68_17545 [Microbulbifer sp. YPW16]
MRKITLLALLALCPALAQADPLPQQLRDCAGIEADAERLACFDRVAGSLDELARKNFGKEQEAATREAPESIVATIEKVEEGAYGKHIFYLENGQVWRQNDSKFVSWEAGQQVEVDRGLFGSFFMRDADGGRSIRVKRVR